MEEERCCTGVVEGRGGGGGGRGKEVEEGKEVAGLFESGAICDEPEFADVGMSDRFDILRRACDRDWYEFEGTVEDGEGW